MRLIVRRVWQALRARLILWVLFRPRTYLAAQAVNAKVQSLGVLGLPRSGTTLLHHLLNLHPDIFLTYEQIFQPLLYLPKSRQFPLFFELLRQHCMLGSNQFDVHLDSLSLPHQRAYAYWGDKMIYPRSRLFERLLCAALRKRKIDRLLIIVRDPWARYQSQERWKERRDRSLAVVSSPPHASLQVEFARWIRFVDSSLRLAARFPDRVLIVSYESLVQNPRENVGRILDFLALTDDPSVMDAMAPKPLRNQSEMLHDVDDKLRVAIAERYQQLSKISGAFSSVAR